MRPSIVPAAALLLTAVSIHAQELKGSGTVALRAARLIDGSGTAAITNGVVVVTMTRSSPSASSAAVRDQAKYGADVIKMCATGGVLSEGDAVGVQQ